MADISNSVTEFHQLINKGSNVPYGLCKSIVVGSLKNISNLITQITTLKHPLRIVNKGRERCQLMTAKGVLVAEIACLIDVLRYVDEFLKRNKVNENKKEVLILQEQLVKIFRDYEEYDFKDFKMSCNNAYSIINAS